MDGESNGSMRVAMTLLGVLVAAVIWHELRPHSSFAAEGVDAAWDAAVQDSRQRNLPGVVLYTADWCPACQALRAGPLSDSAVWRELQHRTFLTVDMTNPTDAVRAHAREAGVSAIPTLIRYDRNGHETGRTHGMSVPELITWLRQDD
jgi:thiol:disulfide interchange protein